MIIQFAISSLLVEFNYISKSVLWNNSSPGRWYLNTARMIHSIRVGQLLEGSTSHYPKHSIPRTCFECVPRSNRYICRLWAVSNCKSSNTRLQRVTQPPKLRLWEICWFLLFIVDDFYRRYLSTMDFRMFIYIVSTTMLKKIGFSCQQFVDDPSFKSYDCVMSVNNCWYKWFLIMYMIRSITHHVVVNIDMIGANTHYQLPWWRHQMDIYTASLALCEGNSPVTCKFPSQRVVTRSFDVFFNLRLNKRLSKPSRRRWFETPPLSL